MELTIDNISGVLSDLYSTKNADDSFIIYALLNIRKTVNQAFFRDASTSEIEEVHVEIWKFLTFCAVSKNKSVCHTVYGTTEVFLINMFQFVPKILEKSFIQVTTNLKRGSLLVLSVYTFFANKSPKHNLHNYCTNFKTSMLINENLIDSDDLPNIIDKIKYADNSLLSDLYGILISNIVNRLKCEGESNISNLYKTLKAVVRHATSFFNAILDSYFRNEFDITLPNFIYLISFLCNDNESVFDAEYDFSSIAFDSLQIISSHKEYSPAYIDSCLHLLSLSLFIELKFSVTVLVNDEAVKIIVKSSDKEESISISEKEALLRSIYFYNFDLHLDILIPNEDDTQNIYVKKITSIARILPKASKEDQTKVFQLFYDLIENGSVERRVDAIRVFSSVVGDILDCEDEIFYKIAYSIIFRKKVNWIHCLYTTMFIKNINEELITKIFGPTGIDHVSNVLISFLFKKNATLLNEVTAVLFDISSNNERTLSLVLNHLDVFDENKLISILSVVSKILMKLNFEDFDTMYDFILNIALEILHFYPNSIHVLTELFNVFRCYDLDRLDESTNSELFRKVSESIASTLKFLNGFADDNNPSFLMFSNGIICNELFDHFNSFDFDVISGIRSYEELFPLMYSAAKIIHNFPYKTIKSHVNVLKDISLYIVHIFPNESSSLFIKIWDMIPMDLRLDSIGFLENEFMNFSNYEQISIWCFLVWRLVLENDSLITFPYVINSVRSLLNITSFLFYPNESFFFQKQQLYLQLPQDSLHHIRSFIQYFSCVYEVDSDVPITNSMYKEGIDVPIEIINSLLMQNTIEEPKKKQIMSPIRQEFKPDNIDLSTDYTSNVHSFAIPLQLKNKSFQFNTCILERLLTLYSATSNSAYIEYLFDYCIDKNIYIPLQNVEIPESALVSAVKYLSIVKEEKLDEFLDTLRYSTNRDLTIAISSYRYDRIFSLDSPHIPKKSLIRLVQAIDSGTRPKDFDKITDLLKAIYDDCSTNKRMIVILMLTYQLVSKFQSEMNISEFVETRINPERIVCCNELIMKIAECTFSNDHNKLKDYLERYHNLLTSPNSPEFACYISCYCDVGSNKTYGISEMAKYLTSTIPSFFKNGLRVYIKYLSLNASNVSIAKKYFNEVVDNIDTKLEQFSVDELLSDFIKLVVRFNAIKIRNGVKKIVKLLFRMVNSSSFLVISPIIVDVIDAINDKDFISVIDSKKFSLLVSPPNLDLLRIMLEISGRCISDSDEYQSFFLDFFDLDIVKDNQICDVRVIDYFLMLISYAFENNMENTLVSCICKNNEYSHYFILALSVYLSEENAQLDDNFESSLNEHQKEAINIIRSCLLKNSFTREKVEKAMILIRTDEERPDTQETTENS